MNRLATSTVRRRLTVAAVLVAAVAGTAGAASALTVPVPLPGGQQETCIVLVNTSGSDNALCVDY